MTTPNPPQSGPQGSYPGAPGQAAPHNYPTQPGYPGGPGQPPAEPPAPPKKKRTWLRIVLPIAVIAVIAVIGFVSKFVTGDPDTAKVGDCMSGTSAQNLKVVKCTEAGADYKVVGKVDGKSQTEFNVGSERICRPFAGTESAFWKGESGGKGYVLCLGSNK
ncbi:MAG TPA: hypothetical protein VFU43_09645 [Streptosporangiaceae bacterium]|nr:hypothetical protein [Streptosporangiaceae bacterium]